MESGALCQCEGLWMDLPWKSQALACFFIKINVIQKKGEMQVKGWIRLRQKWILVDKESSSAHSVTDSKAKDVYFQYCLCSCSHSNFCALCFTVQSLNAANVALAISCLRQFTLVQYSWLQGSQSWHQEGPINSLRAKFMNWDSRELNLSPPTLLPPP